MRRLRCGLVAREWSPSAGDGAEGGLTQACGMRRRTFVAFALAFGLGLAISLVWSLVRGYGL